MSGQEKFGLMPGTAPGVVHIQCPCGHQPEINLRDLTIKFVHCSRCGAEYDRLGFVLHASAWDRPEWNDAGAVRERLFLLSRFGPVALKPQEWRYDARRDLWQYVGRDFSLSGSRVSVGTEASASLARLEKRWRVPRADALRMIGYPEQ